GLYNGSWAALAARRYVRYWLPLLLRLQQQPGERDALLPPLDVALVWMVHRTNVHAYAEDCIALQDDEYGGGAEGGPGAVSEPELLHGGPEQALAFCDGEDEAGAATRQVWNDWAAEPYWPPQQPQAGGGGSVWLAISRSAGGCEEQIQERLLAALPRAPWLLRKLMAGGFGGTLPELELAVDRYCRFLLLAQRHQHEELQPPPDVLLVWWAHKAHSGAYLADMDLLMGSPFDLPGQALDEPELV
ncbi:hypothetical protein TSOC_002776, partial [Tetrabaena socialis]